MNDLLYSGATAQMKPALRDYECTIFFGENITFAKGGTEREGIPSSLVVRVREIEIIYGVQSGRIL